MFVYLQIGLVAGLFLCIFFGAIVQRLDPRSSFGHFYDNTQWLSKIRSSFHDIYNLQSVKNSRFSQTNTTLKNDSLAKFLTTDNTTCDERRYLVFVCDGSRLCGGLGDREKGIISTFLLAMLSNRTYVIHMSHPCPLENFQRPNQYDWLSCKNYALGIPKNEIQTVGIIDRKPGLLHTFKDMDFQKVWTKKVVHMSINWLVTDAVRERMISEGIFSALSWSTNLTKEGIIQAVMNILFEPIATLSGEIKTFLHEYAQNRTLVCAHIRVGKNPSIPHDNAKGNRMPIYPKIIQFLQTFNDSGKYAVFVATDSAEVRAACYSNISNYISLNKSIVHVDRLGGMEKNSACEGLYNAILEQRLLSKCKILLLTQSNFGGIASYLRGRGELYMYDANSHAIEQIQLEEMALRYHLAKR